VIPFPEVQTQSMGSILTLYLEKLVVVQQKRCCLLYRSLNVCQYCCMVWRLVLLILQSDSHFNLSLTESYVMARCLVIRLLWFVNFFRFKTRRRINLGATESLCYQIYLAREQFMWPNIEEILLTMFVYMR